MLKKVIIIDDSITQLNLLKSAFGSNGWEVYGALNVKDGWEMITDIAPDLVVTDAIMPKIGGFQLIKTLREEKASCVIPVIIYSVLSENNAKFYINKKERDYFIQKTQDTNQLLDLAKKVVETHPISDDEKIEILKISLNKFHSQEKEIKPITEDIFAPETIEEEPKIEPIQIDCETLAQDLKNIYNFTYSDEKLIQEFFSILYPILKYDLFTISLYSFEEEKTILYFDIRDIILSPIFQNKMAEKYQAQDIILFKQYAPNLKMIISEEEFCSEIKFSFEYRDKKIGEIAFYSKEKSKWDEIENLENLKDVLYGFFKARYINKNLNSSKNETKKDKYSLNLFDFPFQNKHDTKSEKEATYLGIIEILNFETLEEELTSEELDMLNLKISDKIIKCLDINEQIYKNAKDEYIIMIFASDNKQANHKLNYIANAINSIQYEEYKLEIVIGASNCIIDNTFDVTEAKKTARLALDTATKQEKVVIKNARKQNTDADE